MTTNAHEKAPRSLSSSRLDRSQSAAPALVLREQEVTDQTIHYCERSFDQSPFFEALAEARLDDAVMRYVFVQYRFFRNQLPRWFGHSISLAPGSSEPSQRAAIMQLANHLHTDLVDDHVKILTTSSARLAWTWRSWPAPQRPPRRSATFARSSTVTAARGAISSAP